MRLIVFLVFVVGVAFVAWPYFDLMRLERAVREGDSAALSGFIDLAAVQASMDRGPAGTRQPATRSPAKAGSRVPEEAAALDWVRETMLARQAPADLDSLFPGVSFAFFETPTRFMVRFGELGSGALHLYTELSLVHGRWRVTGIYF